MRSVGAIQNKGVKRGTSGTNAQYVLCAAPDRILRDNQPRADALMPGLRKNTGGESREPRLFRLLDGKAEREDGRREGGRVATGPARVKRDGEVSDSNRNGKGTAFAIPLPFDSRSVAVPSPMADGFAPAKAVRARRYCGVLPVRSIGGYC